MRYYPTDSVAIPAAETLGLETMLLGLLAAALLATLLQLNALRARRSEAYACSSDGVIHMRCWTVVETHAAPAFAWTAPLLALAAPVRRPAPLQFVGEMRMMAARPARTPSRVRPMVHAGVNRSWPREGDIVIPADVLIRMLPSEPAWPAHSRAPPVFARAGPAPAASLH